MKDDQIKAEKEAVEEVLGSDYAGKTLSEISSDILNADAKDYDTENKSNAYYDEWNDKRTTVENFIKERKANIFLEKYCGIQLNNSDTGAITGSDANITLKAGDVVNGTTLTADNLQKLKTKYESAASLSSDGQTIIIGTGSEKTDHSIIMEIGNKYTATTSQAQNIKTGSNDWLVVATNANDTILTGGADSVDAGAGNDKITVGADYASILTGVGNDTVEISAEVKNVTLADLNSNDVLKISGTFEVGAAQIEDTLLVITDKTGTRKIRLGDFETAKDTKINSTTIAEWLTNSGIDLNSLEKSSSSNEIIKTVEDIATVTSNDGGQIEIDPDYKPSPKSDTSIKETQDIPHKSSNSTGQINVNLDNVTLQSGDLEIDNIKVGEISNEFPNITSYTKNGLTINLVGITDDASGDTNNIQNKTFNELTEDQKTIVAGLFKWWAKECLQLNEESYGISFNSLLAMVKEIGLFFYDSKGSGNTLAAVWNWSSNNGQKTTRLMLNVNMHYYSGISSEDMDGTSTVSGAGLLDRTLAHEFTHAVMATNISYFNKLPKFIKEGMAELTHGIDDTRSGTIFKIAYDADWLNASIDLENTGTGSQAVGDGYSGGYMLLRYFAKQAALQTLFDDIDLVNPLFVTGTEENDNISNVHNGVTILALNGDDSIYNSGDDVSIEAGAGNDSIKNGGGPVLGGNNVSITSGDGNDTIESYGGDNLIIDGGAGDDSIDSQASKNATILGGEGNDYVYSWANENSIIKGGEGKDSITNIGNFVKVDGGNGDDSIKNGGSSVSIDGGEGDDKISSSGSNVTISGGDGVDEIENTGASSTIDGGEGADSISNYSDKVSIRGGKGDDLISLSSNVTNNLIIYDEGDGNDIVKGFNGTTTLQIGDGTAPYSSTKSGNDIIVTVGDGSITLIGVATLDVNIAGNNTDPDSKPNSDTPSEEDDYIINSLNAITINALDGNDTVRNLGMNVTIDAGTGNDSIYNSGDSVSISGGQGSDVIDNHINNVKINGGSGNDSVWNYAEDVTIDGGDDSDKISNEGSSVSINGGSGSDDISNLKGSNVTIEAGLGNDIILNDEDGNSALINGGDGKDTIFNGSSNVTINAGTGDDFILNDAYSSNALINTEAGNDHILNGGDNSSINAGEGDDTIENGANSNVIINSGEGDDYISNQGSNATINAGKGNDTIENIDGVFKEGADIFNQGENVLFQYASGDGNDLIKGFNSTSTLKISGSEYSSVKNNNDIIISIGDGKITLSGAASLSSIHIDGTLASGTDTLPPDTIPADKILLINNSTKSPLTLSAEIKIADASARTKAIKIIGNESANSIIGGKGNDTLDGSGGNDTLTGGAGNDVFIYNGGEDVISDYAPTDKISVSSTLTYNNFSISSSDVILNYGENNSLRLIDGVNKNITFIEGKKTVVNFYSAEGIFNSNQTAVTLANTSSDFNATVNSKLVTIDGALTDAISIAGNDKANRIIAGLNGSTLNGDKGNDTLTGGAGADVFVYESIGGSDIILNYGAGDKISLGSGAIISDASTTKNGDTTFKIGKNSITVKNSSEIILTAAGSDSIYSGGVFRKGDSVTLPTTFAKSFELGDYKNVDGSLAKKSVSIQGGTSSDSLLGGAGADKLYGNDGNDTLCGNKGNDSLWGGAGDDTFIFKAGDGTDTILDYQNGDLLQILDKNSNAGSFSKASFSNNTLNLTITGGGTIALKNLDNTINFNINGEIYHVNGKTITK